MHAGSERPRGRRWLPAIALASGLFTILLSLFMLHVFSRNTAIRPAPDHDQHQKPSLTPTVTHVNNFRPIVTPTPTPVVLPDPAQEAGYILHPKDHIAREPTTLRMSWSVTRELRKPDGVEKQVYLINGQFPGPIIEARPSDELEINVFNHVENDTEGISVHWHGLVMNGANAMDGVVGVTQCAIAHNNNFTYRFTLDDSQHGTYWYHAHSHVQRADGLYGGIVIHRPANAETDLVKYNYEQEKLLLVGDWYHWPANRVLEWYDEADHFGYEPAPDSLLINGVGAYNCSKAVAARVVNCTMLQKPNIRLPDADRMRLRIVNTGASAGFSMNFGHGTMQILAVDGQGLVDRSTPAAGGVGILYPGERVDVVLDKTLALKSDRDESSINTLTIELDDGNMPLKNYALTRIQSFPVGDLGKTADRKINRRDDAVKMLSLADLNGVSLSDEAAEATKPAETAVFYTTIKNRATHANRPAGLFNHSSWIVKDAFAAPLLAVDEEQWPSLAEEPSRLQNFTVSTFKASAAGRKTRWMDMVVNNLDDKGHPFHLHGRSFYVLVSHKGRKGEQGTYNPFDPESKHDDYPRAPFNHLLKDTVYIPRMGHVVLRLPLTNSGLWLAHCHILWHQAVGMSMVVRVGDVDPNARRAAGAFCASQNAGL
ncbi:ferro-O2-oxidoreductase [Cordyceps fumosorosea ARSEF 2679]|uniref:Ferro-O2-oxidoreductase n=1 Tax=Cordyceps fumosorosea (strain ARSEF 2679) TaxID=1081104 RepID=A0A167LPN8_CORFA|nr:ferro-O2-oxidoreductase [Cordyceps fumosorosea ARSEF 2679]OAA53343.1 ferro-O2-oxidoreductase [Cordyceps fumosorosea ARSEF 2679]